jgi:hypothetical protein
LREVKAPTLFRQTANRRRQLRQTNVREKVQHTTLSLDSISPSSYYYYLYYFVCEAIGTEATPGLLCQPRVIVKMILEKQMEFRLAGQTEVLGENLPQRHVCPSQNPT